MKNNNRIPSEPEKIDERRAIIQKCTSDKVNILFNTRFDEYVVARHNCENLVGSVEIPLGIAGPITLNHSEFINPIYVPLATTEAALVASVNRGLKTFELSGGITTLVDYKGMTRAPLFEAIDGQTALLFVDWVRTNQEQLFKACESTSKHLKMISVASWIVGRHIYLRFTADTDQAMGMNMLTIAVKQAVEAVVVPKWRKQVIMIALSSNLCTDKKENCINGILGRGYWCQAEGVINQNIIETVLKTKIETLLHVHVQKNLLGSSLAGSHSHNAHTANIAAALFLATGQDPAHVVEASQATLSLEKTKLGLYGALTMNNLNLGVLGGGTDLPTANAGREIISPKLTARGLAQVVAATALAGEVSLLAALATGSLASSHARLTRRKCETA